MNERRVVRNLRARKSYFFPVNTNPQPSNQPHQPKEFTQTRVIMSSTYRPSFPPSPFVDEYRRAGGLHKTCLLAPCADARYETCETHKDKATGRNAVSAADAPQKTTKGPVAVKESTGNGLCSVQ